MLQDVSTDAQKKMAVIDLFWLWLPLLDVSSVLPLFSARNVLVSPFMLGYLQAFPMGVVSQQSTSAASESYPTSPLNTLSKHQACTPSLHFMRLGER